VPETAYSHGSGEYSAGILADIEPFRNHMESDDYTGYLLRHADTARCLEWLRAAKMGSPEAQWLVSRCYRLGHGLRENMAEALSPRNRGTRPEEAVASYRKAAAAGHGEACLRLAECLAEGIGGATDMAEAVAWYHNAAE
jgi:TPR repeat protein